MTDNTLPIKQGDKKLSRKFLGNMFSRLPIEQKEFKAYKRGDNVFTYGRDHMGNKMYHEVRQEYFYL